jgi:hypothetical protein
MAQPGYVLNWLDRDLTRDFLKSLERMRFREPGAHEFHLEPRCCVCRNDRVRGKVNDLLATAVGLHRARTRGG